MVSLRLLLFLRMWNTERFSCIISSSSSCCVQVKWEKNVRFFQFCSRGSILTLHLGWVDSFHWCPATFWSDWLVWPSMAALVFWCVCNVIAFTNPTSSHEEQVCQKPGRSECDACLRLTHSFLCNANTLSRLICLPNQEMLIKHGNQNRSHKNCLNDSLVP